MTSRPRLGVVGSCNVDLVVRVAHLARPGETVLGSDLVRLAGGKGANQAVAASHLGADVTLVAALGRDESGDWMVSSLVDHGVDVSLLQRVDQPTGTAFITVAADGENQIVVAPGANATLRLEPSSLAAFDVVLAQMEIAPHVIDLASQHASSMILNVAPAAPVDPAVLARCAVVIANEVEAELLDLAALDECVVTLGAKGAVLYQRGREVERATAQSVSAVDTVGAGDVFCAAYATRYACGDSVDQRLRYAVAAGTLATQGFGAQGALPSDEEVRQWLERG